MANDVQPTQDTDQAPHVQGTLSVQEAAAHYRVTEKTIRRRIKAGSLRAVKHSIAEGFEWRVYPEGGLDSAKGTQPTHEGPQTEQETHTPPAVPSDPPQQSAELLRALEVVERLTQRNEQLAGQLGFTQAKLQEAERTVALLMMPTDEPAPEPPAQPERVSWWKRILR